ncbi:hypothetical protein [Mycolicibacterium aubagnense]|uniref:Uncharacterized protein n=1 Tax=Mycolicibacterium aubagnense TaxID=319707 RepID=A0ABM7IJE4_9MYCO|nr:hypothetical protein [Mycolicibacterium aubagnense]TLH58185.1 hypothetical protein C1S80_21255 [Mycolicibacterium aubagnense]WGI31602.1 hypothetical protein QDT91_20565 [Mycolicibacterium aubagnense]BBX86937.1 hypothetical protein MAUB_48100 [Mycolicibacterium aubagnense]
MTNDRHEPADTDQTKAAPEHHWGGFHLPIDKRCLHISYDYADDQSGETILSNEPYGLRRTGKMGAIFPWAAEQLPAATAALVAESAR